MADNENTSPSTGSDESFDLTWAPPRYAMYDPATDGVWRVVTDSGAPVGIIWCDYGDSTGVTWIKQTPAITGLNQHFINMKMIDAYTGSAYLLAQQLPGVELADEQSGPLSGVDDAFKQMMDSAD